MSGGSTAELREGDARIKNGERRLKTAEILEGPHASRIKPDLKDSRSATSREGYSEDIPVTSAGDSCVNRHKQSRDRKQLR
ncbi:hypothetical protein RRG08_040068 [Elysia crispata]|uniref:Uncharacterized protein n=1 Tax=Elysia crispata TaxID=231223 RepID=A0AAE1CND5_9GAST|nr:hypothetical protein RRG08_040068 [Elysia crispata]